MKHITPIEEAVALAAIKKFRLHNQLEDENDESDPAPYTSDQDETGLSEAEEIEAEIEKEQEVEVDLYRLLKIDWMSSNLIRAWEGLIWIWPYFRQSWMIT